MKKIISLLTYLILTFSVVAQSNIRLNNYWANMLTLNPASIYDKYQAVFNMAARKQWVGVDGAPTTFFASGSTYFEDFHTQLGLNLFQDKIGYTSTTSISISYAYAITLSYEWQLHLGLAGNYQAFSYDLSKVNIESGTDNVPLEKMTSAFRLNADFGFEFSNKSVKIGAVGQNLFSLFPSDRPLQTNTNFVYAKYHQESGNVFNLGAGVCAIQYSNIYQVEFNLTSYFKFYQFNGLIDKPDLFDIGVFYRTQSQAGMIFGFNITDAIHLSYSYDYHFGGIRFGSFGTNEVMLTYNLARKAVCHNCWY